MVRREARQVALSVERDEVAEVGIGRIERVGGVERISPAGREVAGREAPMRWMLWMLPFSHSILFRSATMPFE